MIKHDVSRKLAQWAMFLAAVTLAPLSAIAQTWQPVRGSILFGISGMAPLNSTPAGWDVLVVHDNKNADEGRFAVVSQTEGDWLQYRPLAWPADLAPPIDLEALTAVPETNTFIALASDGTAYHVGLEGDRVQLITSFELPDLPENTNLESFALQKLDGRLVAVWAHRGGGDDPAMLYWGMFDLADYSVSDVSAVAIQVPVPSGDSVRHLSDVTVDEAGVVYGSAASDNGDNGPFASAVYVLGVLSPEAEALRFIPSTLVPLISDDFHKVEAIARVPGDRGGIWLGSDDESFGGFIWRSHDF